MHKIINACKPNRYLSPPILVALGCLVLLLGGIFVPLAQAATYTISIADVATREVTYLDSSGNQTEHSTVPYSFPDTSGHSYHCLEPHADFVHGNHADENATKYFSQAVITKLGMANKWCKDHYSSDDIKRGIVEQIFIWKILYEAGFGRDGRTTDFKADDYNTANYYSSFTNWYNNNKSKYKGYGVVLHSTQEGFSNAQKVGRFWAELAVGSLSITKHVQVNNSSDNVGTLVDGTYKFNVSGPDNYSTTVNIVISGGASSTETLNNLTPGNYTVTEQETPSDRISVVGSSSQEVTVSAGDTATVSFTNNRNLYGSMSLTKTISHDSTIVDQPTLSPAHAVFGLYNDANCTNLYRDLPETDANGYTHLDNIPTTQNGRVLYIKEKTPPNGCVYSTEVTNVTIYDGQDATASRTNYEFYGYAGAIKLSNIDNSQIHKSGFRFVLYKADKSSVIETKDTDDDGVVTFNSKLAAGTYYVKETVAPEPFEVNADFHKVVIEQDGTSANARSQGDGTTTKLGPESGKNNLVVTYIKDKQYGHIRVTKVNAETGQAIKQSGFVFALSGTEISGTRTATTDDEGVAVFDHLRVRGTYTLTETAVPGPPYNRSQETKTITLTEDGNLGKIMYGYTDPIISPNVENVFFVDFGNCPQYGRVTLTKADGLDEHLQDGGGFKVILKDEAVTYLAQRDETGTPSREYPVSQTTALTQGSSYFDEDTGKVTVTNPVIFSTDANGGTTDTFTTENGTLTTGWLPIDQGGTSHYALVEVQASDGHLINGHEIPFTLTYEEGKLDNDGIETTASQEEMPNEIDIYKVAKKDNTPIQGATLGFWATENNLVVDPVDAHHDAYALRVSDAATAPVLNQQIDGAEIDGSGIKEGYIVHLVMEGHDDIVIDIEHDEIEHAPIGTYGVTLKNSEGRVVNYTGPSTIETKEGSAVNVSVTQSALTGKMLLETTVGEIANRQTTMTYDEASHTYITRDLKPHTTYNVEIARKTVKVIHTSEEGGTTWFGRYSLTDATWFADHYIDQGALPDKDDNIVTHALVSKEDHEYKLVTDEEGHINVKRIRFGSYVLAEIKPAVNTLTHRSWLVDTTTYRFTVDSVSGYIKFDDVEDDFAKKKAFTFVDDVTKLNISKKEMTGGPEIPGALLTLISKENDIVEEWTSREEPHYIENLQPGVYTLIERVNPREYEKAESIQFTLLPTGEVQHTEMFDAPISINAHIDKRQEIARPLDERYEANMDENNALQQSNEAGSYSYSLDFRSTSNTWTDEFTVTDPMEPANDDLAYLESVVTPQAFQDYDGKMNVWYKTNKTPADYVETAGGTMSERKTIPEENEDETTPDETGDTGTGNTETGNAETGNTETGDTSATPLTLTPVTDSNPVTIEAADSAVIAACSVKIGEQSIGSLTPALSGYTVAFDKRADMMTADAPSITGFPTVTDPEPTWSFTAKGEAVTDESTTCKNTITITHGDNTYVYIILYTCSEEVPVTQPKGANATVTDGHVNQWLDDKDAMAADTDGDKRIIDFKGWKLWEEGVSTTVAKKLNVSDLKLDADEHITGLRFEYGRVEVGFKTRVDEWERELLQSKHDDLDEINGTSAVSFSDAFHAADAAAARARILSEFFTIDGAKAQEAQVAAAIKQAKKDYEEKLISIDEYNAKLDMYAEDTLPRFAEALVLPPYSDDDTADDVVTLDAAVQAARVSILSAFQVGNPNPVSRAVLLEASKDALEDVRGLISPELAKETEEAIAGYSTAMDKVPAPEGGEGLDMASAKLLDCFGRILDEIRLSGLSGRVMYAPAVLRMRLTDKYVLGAVLRNSADVDAYRNGGNYERSNELEGHDHDEVEQTPRKKDIHIGTRLSTRQGEKVVTSDGSQAIKMIDTVDYHGLTPGHEYVISGDLHIRKTEQNTVTDGGAISGSDGSTRFVPTASEGTVEVEMTVPAGNVAPVTAFEELRVIIPKTGQVSDYTLAVHKDITDESQTVYVTAPAADLVQTGQNVATLVGAGMLCLSAVLGATRVYHVRKSA